MRKYVVLVILLITGYVMILGQGCLIVTFYTPESSEDIDDTLLGGYRYFVLKEPHVALKVSIRANDSFDFDYKNGTFQIRAYHEVGKYFDKNYNKNYDVIFERDNFTVLRNDFILNDIPLSIKIKHYPFARVRCFYKNILTDNIYIETDYDGNSSVVITDSRDSYEKYMKKIRVKKEKEKIKNSIKKVREEE